MKKMRVGISTRIAAIAAVPVISALAFTGVKPVHASTILPYPSALDYGRVLGVNDTGAQLVTAWQENASNTPGGCTNPRTAGITVNGNSVILTSNGSDCEYLQTPHTYPTNHDYVYEESVTITQWTTWQSFWAYGNGWPTNGEIDNIEASPTGQNNISWHDSTTPPDGFSTCNSANGCNGAMQPITNPSNADSLAHGLAPGTHIIDFAFGGTGIISVWYDGTQVTWLQTNQNIGGTANNDPFWIVNSNGKAENGSTTSGAFQVNYFRGWS